jgi:hypothetical protein
VVFLSSRCSAERAAVQEPRSRRAYRKGGPASISHHSLPRAPFARPSYPDFASSFLQDLLERSSRAAIRPAPLRPPLERRFRATARLACFSSLALRVKANSVARQTKAEDSPALDQPLSFHALATDDRLCYYSYLIYSHIYVTGPPGSRTG